MKKQFYFIFILILLFVIVNCVKVNASLEAIFNISPTPISTTFYGFVDCYPTALGINATLYNITIYQSTTYTFYCHVTLDGIDKDGTYAVYTSSLTTTEKNWDVSEIGDDLTLIKSIGFYSGYFNFQITQQYDSESTLYNFYVIPIHVLQNYVLIHTEFILSITYEKGEDGGVSPYIDVGFGNFSMQSLTLLFVLVFVPSLITAGIFSTQDLGFIGFLCGLNVMTAIAYQFGMMPLWFLFVVVIIDIILILEILHSSGRI